MRSTDGGPWFYPDRVSAAPGDTVTIHASSAESPCRLVVSRVGLEREPVVELAGIRVPDASIPEGVETTGCGWDAVRSFTIDPAWRAGYYDLELVDPSGRSTHHYVCVRRDPAEARRPAAIVLNTNTYQAYNYWGGANSYAHVDGMMTGELTPDDARARALGRLSLARPFPQRLLAPPPGAPRLVNLERRGIGEMGFPGTPEWMAANVVSPYDGSAGFVGKWEHAFVAWAERIGLDFDYVTDHDFESEPAVLEGYDAVFLVGHSEYWSGVQRRQLDGFVDGGGRLAILSGNTGYWKVRWEDGARTLVAHKWRGETDDPLWADPVTRADATHLWSHPAFARPEAELTGLSFLYGGYHRLVMCAARGAGAYTVYDDDHWALEGTDLYYGDTFGGEVPLLGYENDGCPIRFGARGLPVPDGGVGVPPHLNVIAIAPATLFEPPRSPFPPVIPPEEPDVLAEIAYGLDGAAGRERVARGHAVLASFERGAGEVFNAGTTEWVHGLAAGDPFVERITRNVIERFCPKLLRTARVAG